METITPLLLLGALGYTLVNLVKFLRARDVDGVVTTLGAWLVGFLLVVVGSHAELTQNWVVPGLDVALGSLDWWSQLLLGASALSLFGVAYDFKKAIDSTDSAKVPTLLPGGDAPPPH